MSFPGEVKLRTLVVEDNAPYRGIIKDTLKTLFPTMVIQEASKGKEAIQKVGVFHYGRPYPHRRQGLSPQIIDRKLQPLEGEPLDS